jgi:hypothetical protein
MKARNEMKIMKEIKRNLRHHNATVTKADKGQTLIIIYQTEQNTKTQLSLTNNRFQLTHKDPTNMFKKEARKKVTLAQYLLYTIQMKIHCYEPAGTKNQSITQNLQTRYPHTPSCKLETSSSI